MLHNEARKLVLEAWDKTHNAKEIAKYFSVNESTVYRLVEERTRTGISKYSQNSFLFIPVLSRNFLISSFVSIFFSLAFYTLCICRSIFFHLLQHLSSSFWYTLRNTQAPRGCQVIATKNMRLFYHENGLKPHISV